MNGDLKEFTARLMDYFSALPFEVEWFQVDRQRDTGEFHITTSDLVFRRLLRGRQVSGVASEDWVKIVTSIDNFTFEQQVCLPDHKYGVGPVEVIL